MSAGTQASTSWSVEIRARGSEFDPVGHHLLRAAHQSGFDEVTGIRASRLFFLKGALSHSEAGELVERLLGDPVALEWELEPPSGDAFVDVAYRPGVTDTEAENLAVAAQRVGWEVRAATGWRFRVEGGLERERLEELAERLLANPVVHQFSVGECLKPALVESSPVEARVETVPLREADDGALEGLSQKLRLALDLAEMQAIRAFYREEGREPTGAELQTLAQTWSEHCVHKTFRAEIDYRGPEGERQKVDGLLKSLIRRATEELNLPWVRSAFVDNAGVVEFYQGLNLAIKAETHNHPSALEPFGGANTGVGGVIRDILGVSARPMACTDVLCFAPPDLPADRIPEGTLAPARIIDGVVRGIADYGNKMGIPTVAGAVVFHPDYVANPLVYCGCLGIVPEGAHPRSPQPGDLIVVTGGRTGRDGLGGATFSSLEMDATTAVTSSTAVQIGHPIQEKVVAEALLLARDERLYNAVTDCGAGGLSSAVGEMGAELGARVDLALVPLKYPGLMPWEIWLSEAQERMVFAVPPSKWERFQEVCRSRAVEASAIGEFEDTGRLRLFHGELAVGDLPMHFLHEGIPRRSLEASWTPPEEVREKTPEVEPGRALLALLSSPDLCSREPVVSRYDHEVQGGTAVKPLGADGAVLVPLELQTDGPAPAAVLACGINPHLSAFDPGLMAWAAVDEAIRNAVAMGADPDRIALLDNFCWGNPRLPDRLGALVRCCQAVYEASIFYGAPFVSGKDSLNNEFVEPGGERRAIPGTLLVTALGRVDNWEYTASAGLTSSGNLIFMVGETRHELGGSLFFRLLGGEGGKLPEPARQAPALFRGLHQAHRQGLVRSCHDLSEGGLLVALAEMCLMGRLGATLELGGIPGTPGMALSSLLFSESLSRFLVEVRPEDADRFLALFPGLPVALAGTVNGLGALVVRDGKGEKRLEVEVSRLAEAARGSVFDCLGGARPTGERPELSAGAVGPVRPAGAARVAVLWAPGTNREREAALACELAGARVDILSLDRATRLSDYAMVVLPGGFSYGDDLGSGRLWALDLELALGDELRRFVDEGRSVLGICNGFQALVRAGLLPGGSAQGTLAHNRSGHFECRWVRLEVQPESPCRFTRGLEGGLVCPAAHGEGRWLSATPEEARALAEAGQVPLRYSGSSYPLNPNGSMLDIAAVCNPEGNVMGLMPHPEDNVFPWQHPARRGPSGLVLFRNGL